MTRLTPRLSSAQPVTAIDPAALLPSIGVSTVPNGGSFVVPLWNTVNTRGPIATVPVRGVVAVLAATVIATDVALLLVTVIHESLLTPVTVPHELVTAIVTGSPAARTDAVVDSSTKAQAG